MTVWVSRKRSSARTRIMDQAESSPSPGQPERPSRPARTPTPKPEEVAAETGPEASTPEASTGVPDPAALADLQSSALRLEHPVIVGFDGSESSRNAL